MREVVEEQLQYLVRGSEEGNKNFIPAPNITIKNVDITASFGAPYKI